MIKRALVLTALLVPLTALALEIRPADFYTDVRTSSHEAAGINLLTREGIVQGYGEGRFGPARLINRAEFLKIAILASPDAYDVLPAMGGCFPDVKPGDWFAPYVCTAKAAGIVSGNARANVPQDQWTFNPEAPVTYDAALKMLVLLFHYPIPNVAGNDWAEPYYQAATLKGVDLPIRITFDTRLTRGMAARLAGAFLAESEGKLAEYRRAEAGEYPSSASSSVSSSASSSVSSSVSSSASSSSSSSSVASLFTLPSVSHFLVVGTTTDAIADGIIRSNNEAARIAIVQVKLYQEVRSIDRLELLTSSGQFIANLKRRTTTDITDYAQTFDAQLQPEDQVSIPKDTNVHLVLRAVIRDVNNAGFSNELLQVRTISVTIKGETTNDSINLPVNGPFPKHQTSFGRITSVSRVSPETAPLVSGAHLTMSTYAFSGAAIAGKSLQLHQLVFSLLRGGTVSLSDWVLANASSGLSVSCTMNEEAMTITCPALDHGVGLLTSATPLLLDLTATVSVPAGSQGSTVQTSLVHPGSPEAFGSIDWTDDSGLFHWIEDTLPVLGTRLQ